MKDEARGGGTAVKDREPPAQGDTDPTVEDTGPTTGERTSQVPEVARTERPDGIRIVTEYDMGLGDGVDIATLMMRSPTFRQLGPEIQRRILREALSGINS